jgi:D-alanine-D-alanine ligase
MILALAVLAGGPSPEHDVSLASATQALRALDRDRYLVTPFVIGRDLAWHVPEGPVGPDFDLSELGGSPPVPTGEALERLASQDCALLAIHGELGEDGRIQGLLECLGVPYTGADVAGSALAMDKILTRNLLELAEVPHPAGRVVRRERWSRDPRAEAAAVLAELPPPLVVKSPTQGSSFGVHMVEDAEGFAPAVEAVLAAEDRCLVEERIEGREVTCGVLEDPESGETQALPPTEIVPPEGRYFDFDAKYTPGASREVTPAQLPAEVLAEIQTRALQVHALLGLRGLSRTDMMIPRGGRATVLEVNTIPGLTATSLLPQAAAVAGMEMGELLDRLVASALRGRERKSD